jgi:hypothetical protein
VALEIISMPWGLSMLKFNLMGDGDASFLTRPLQWMQSENALGFPPPFMRVARLDPTTVVVTSDNRLPAGQVEAYHYMLLVFAWGKVYATDPTIINVTPGSG